MRPASRCGVPIPPEHPSLGKLAPRLDFELLRAHPKVANVIAPAGRAGVWNRNAGVTQMTHEVFDRRMVDEGRVTPLTPHDVAAVAAEDEGRVATSIKEK